MGTIMSEREMVLQQVRELDDHISSDEIVEELQILASIRAAEKASDEGRVVPHETVKELLSQWITK